MKKLIPLLMLASLQIANADVPPEQKPEVEHLLKFVEQTDCIMIRNGSEHVGEDAVAHIKKKYRYFEGDIKTTEDFIEYSATKSTMSGKYYTVHCPGKEDIHTQDWLLEELEKFRSNAKQTDPANAAPSPKEQGAESK